VEPWSPGQPPAPGAETLDAAGRHLGVRDRLSGHLGGEPGLAQDRPGVVLGAVLHNLNGLGTSGLVVAKTLRRRLLSLPGRLTRSARRWRLHLPTGWPWARAFARAITRLRALPAAT
jgi:hypothetical protein